jgi:hypothetical protein
MLSFYDMQKANQFMAAPADTLDLASHIAKFYGGNGRLSGAVSRWQLKMPDDLLRAAAAVSTPSIWPIPGISN